MGVPRVESSVEVDVPVEVAFELSQTTGALRLRWDPFIHEQHLLDGATGPAKGVRTSTVSRHRLRMVSEYVSVRPPLQVGMRMVSGPWFFEQMSGGWTFAAVGADRCRAVWRYTFTVRPTWLQFVGHPLGTWLLGRDIRNRIDAFARACADDSILAELPSRQAS